MAAPEKSGTSDKGVPDFSFEAVSKPSGGIQTLLWTTTPDNTLQAILEVLARPGADGVWSIIY